MTASKVAHSIFIALQKPLDRFRRIEASRPIFIFKV